MPIRWPSPIGPLRGTSTIRRSCAPCAVRRKAEPWRSSPASSRRRWIRVGRGWSSIYGMRATRERRGMAGAWSPSGWIALRERQPRAAALAEPAAQQPAAALAVAAFPAEPPLDLHPAEVEPPLGEPAVGAVAADRHHTPPH